MKKKEAVRLKGRDVEHLRVLKQSAGSAVRSENTLERSGQLLAKNTRMKKQQF